MSILSNVWIQFVVSLYTSNLFSERCLTQGAFYLAIKTKIWFHLSCDVIVRLVYSPQFVEQQCSNKSTETSVKWNIPLESFIKKWHLRSYKSTNKLPGNTIVIATIVYKSYEQKFHIWIFRPSYEHKPPILSYLHLSSFITVKGSQAATRKL